MFILIINVACSYVKEKRLRLLYYENRPLERSKIAKLKSREQGNMMCKEM